MARVNYWPCYAGDYMRDTADLTLAEHGALFQLMCFAYATEKPLPAEIESLCRMVRAYTDEERTAVQKVADRFFPIEADGARHNGRVDEEIVKATQRKEVARENGRKGGRPKGTKNPTGSARETRSKPDGITQSKPGCEAETNLVKSSPTPSPTPSPAPAPTPSRSDAIAYSGDTSPALASASSSGAGSDRREGNKNKSNGSIGDSGGPRHVLDVIPPELADRAQEAP